MKSRILSCALVLVTALAVVPSTAAAASLTMDITIGSPCVSGRGPARTRVDVAVHEPDGSLRFQASERSDNRGDWYACGPFSSLTWVEVGDVVTVSAAGQLRRATVRDLYPRIDRDADVIRGTGRGPRGGFLHIVVQSRAEGLLRYTVPVGQDRRWRLDLSGEIDLQGQDLVTVTRRKPGVTQSLNSAVPFVAFSGQSGYLTGARNPGERVAVDLRDADGATRASSATVGIGASFVTVLENVQGRMVSPHRGDRLRVSIAGGITLRVPGWRLRADASANRVTGRCMARAPYELTVEDGDGWDEHTYRGTTRADGSFGRSVPVDRRAEVSLTCRYPHGDAFSVALQSVD